jgi:choice-of-anchor B domain-containing protein
VRLLKAAFALALVGILVAAASAAAHHPQGLWAPVGGIGWFDPDMKKAHDLKQAADSSAVAQAVGFTPCVDGQAGVYPCQNVDLMSFLPLAEIGGGEIGNDIWGWEDPETGRDYAIMGRTNGTAFVDITDPANPVYVGNLPSESTSSAFIFWRDIKVYEDHAFIVSEHRGHGMQVFDLTRLREVESTPATFDADTVYRGITSAHNLFINEDSGFAYVVGSNRCRGGLHIVDVSEPQDPRFEACYSEDGYTHDVQCVDYQGPDDRFTGREICFASNEDTVTIVDVTDKSDPEMLARRGYATAAYTHQGWLTPDQATFLFNDELDELTETVPEQTTYILDVSSLTDPPAPVLSGNGTTAIDHNLYITKGLVYEANYTAGLRIFDAASIPTGDLAELAWFDVFPASDEPVFEGSWSSYPFYDENIVAVSGIDSGLFVLRPQLGG